MTRASSGATLRASGARIRILEKKAGDLRWPCWRRSLTFGGPLGQWWKRSLALGQSLSSWNGSLKSNLIFQQSTPAIHGGVTCSLTIPWRESTWSRLSGLSGKLQASATQACPRGFLLTAQWKWRVAREVQTQNQVVGRPWCNHFHNPCRLLSWYETLALRRHTASTSCLVPAAANSTRRVHSRTFGTQVLEVLLLQVSLERQFFSWSRRAPFAGCGWWQQRGLNRDQHQHAGWGDFWQIRVAVLVVWTGTG